MQRIFLNVETFFSHFLLYWIRMEICVTRSRSFDSNSLISLYWCWVRTDVTIRGIFRCSTLLGSSKKLGNPFWVSFGKTHISSVKIFLEIFRSISMFRQSSQLIVHVGTYIHINLRSYKPEEKKQSICYLNPFNTSFSTNFIKIFHSCSLNVYNAERK